MPGVDPKCANCENFPKDGFCAVLMDALMELLCLYGLSPVKMPPHGRCNRFEASDEAMDDAIDEAAHQEDLRREAGKSYPASL